MMTNGHFVMMVENVHDETEDGNFSVSSANTKVYSFLLLNQQRQLLQSLTAHSQKCIQ